MEKWFIRNRKGNIKDISKKFNISEFISKLLINRNINDNRLIESYINPNLEKLHNPLLLKDLEKTVNIINENIKNKKKMRIVGDFDVDGVMSVYILYMGIKKAGGDVDYTIPDRVLDGYGISNQIVKSAKEEGIHTIITCDNGIAAIEEIELAKELGLKVIVTDHHDIPFITDEKGDKKNIYTDADAVINPKQIDCPYPFKNLCGAAVAFKLIQGLYLSLNIPINHSYNLLEYTAIATVCDVMDLVDENRIIVKKGLELLNNTENIGLKALVKEAGIADKELSVYHLGFVIGPSINASGRLDTALVALELLLTNDENEANRLAKDLRILNEERKKMTTKGVEKVTNIIENSSIKNHKILIIYEPEIHESIAGIIAGRIKEKYNRPTIVLTKGKDGVKGSGRSIEEYNMFEELTKVKEILSRFGGHPMAAGLSLDYKNIDMLRDKLNDFTNLTDEDLIPKIYIDMHLPLDYISFKLINELKILEPFGKGNSKPIFGEKNLKIKRGSVLGVNKNVLKVILENENKKNIEGLFFGDIKSFEESLISTYGKEEMEKLYKGFTNNISIDILYYPSINEFRGNTTLQVIIQNYRFSK